MRHQLQQHKGKILAENVPTHIDKTRMNFEQFIVAFVYSEFLCAGVRTYKSENYIYEAYKEVLNDVSVRKEKTKKGKKKNSKDSTAVNTD